MPRLLRRRIGLTMQSGIHRTGNPARRQRRASDNKARRRSPADAENEMNLLEHRPKPITTNAMHIMQDRVEKWVTTCFGEDILLDKKERVRRFIEEAFELAQAAGLTIDEVGNIGYYVYAREVGKIPQEIGGCGVTFLGIGRAFEIDVIAETEKEILRIESIDPQHFRNKHKAKHEAGVSSDIGSNRNDEGRGAAI
jgi:hypothetical protein